MITIDGDLSTGKFHNVYLLYGPENYLVRQYRDKMIRAFFPEGDSMNLTILSGDERSVENIIDLAETLPFFAERRLIVWEDCNLFSQSGEKLADYLTKVPEATFFVFVEKEVDRRSRLFKTIKDTGHAAEFISPGDDKLKTWILQIIRRDNKQITVGALNLFMDKTGPDMANMRNELEKLLCYCADRPAIQTEDVEAICTTQVTGRIFDMIDAIADKKQKEALNLYYDLLSAKEPPLKILVLLGRQFAQLLAVKELKEKGFDKRRIAEKTGVKPYFIDKTLAQTNRFKRDTLYSAFGDCVKADEAFKKGQISDRICVEIIIVKYSSSDDLKQE